MAAGIATLKEVGQAGFYEALEKRSAALEEGLTKAAREAGVQVTANRVGSMMGLFFTEGPVSNFEQAQKSDVDSFAGYYREMLARGIYLAPSQFEAVFVSAAHSEEDIDRTVAAAREVFNGLKI